MTTHSLGLWETEDDGSYPQFTTLEWLTLSGFAGSL